jgi:hypothetical protein
VESRTVGNPGAEDGGDNAAAGRSTIGSNGESSSWGYIATILLIAVVGIACFVAHIRQLMFPIDEDQSEDILQVVDEN